MARRRTARKKRRAGPRQISLLNVLETYALTSIMTLGLTGYAPWEFLTSGSGNGGNV
jgi:hypothetical protein